ncbi:MAG: hypothetical protein ACFN4K_10165 [Pauljensenia sp.]
MAGEAGAADDAVGCADAVCDPGVVWEAEVGADELPELRILDVRELGGFDDREPLWGLVDVVVEPPVEAGVRVAVDLLPESLLEGMDGVFDEPEGGSPFGSGDVVHVGEAGFDACLAECEVGGDRVFAEAHGDEDGPGFGFEALADLGGGGLAFDDCGHAQPPLVWVFIPTTILTYLHLSTCGAQDGASFVVIPQVCGVALYSAGYGPFD